MRLVCLPILAALVAGCGSGPVEDESVNRQLVTDTVLNWHRMRADKDPAACELVTENALDEMLELQRKLASTIGSEPARDCETMIALEPDFLAYQELLRNTVVDAVAIDGERASVTAHTNGVVNGVPRAASPAEITLRWDGGRWRID